MFREVNLYQELFTSLISKKWRFCQGKKISSPKNFKVINQIRKSLSLRKEEAKQRINRKKRRRASYP